MRGVVIGFLPGARGVIRAEDGKRYEFANSEWHSARTPSVGDEVDFEANEGQALSLFAVRPANAAATAPSAGWHPPVPPAMVTVVNPGPSGQGAARVRSGGGTRFLIVLLAVVILVGCVLPLYDFGLGSGLPSGDDLFNGDGSILALARGLPNLINTYSDVIGGSFFEVYWPLLALLLVPLFAIFAVLGAIVGSGRFFGVLAGLAGLLLPIGLLAYQLSQLGLSIGDLLPDIFDTIGLGGWVITGAGLVLLLAAMVAPRRA